MFRLYTNMTVTLTQIKREIENVQKQEFDGKFEINYY